MLELGCQEIRSGTFPKSHPARQHKIAKDYFESLGIKHVSIDQNGLHGSLNLDLSLPIDGELHSRFDVVTNFGTIEHVDQKGMDGQWQAFKTMHDCTKAPGVMLHTLTQKGHGRWHCVFKYESWFPERLAKANGYELRVNTVFSGILVVSYLKVANTPFVPVEELSGIVYTRGGKL
jgi:hypothetical protein